MAIDYLNDRVWFRVASQTTRRRFLCHNSNSWKKHEKPEKTFPVFSTKATSLQRSGLWIQLAEDLLPASSTKKVVSTAFCNKHLIATSVSGLQLRFVFDSTAVRLFDANLQSNGSWIASMGIKRHRVKILAVTSAFLR